MKNFKETMKKVGIAVLFIGMFGVVAYLDDPKDYDYSNADIGTEVELIFDDMSQMEDFIFNEFLFIADTYPNQLVRHCPEYVI